LDLGFCTHEYVVGRTWIHIGLLPLVGPAWGVIGGKRWALIGWPFGIVKGKPEHHPRVERITGSGSRLERCSNKSQGGAWAELRKCPLAKSFSTCKTTRSSFGLASRPFFDTHQHSIRFFVVWGFRHLLHPAPLLPALRDPFGRVDVVLGPSGQERSAQVR
jgi:hypothetical protein